MLRRIMNMVVSFFPAAIKILLKVATICDKVKL